MHPSRTFGNYPAKCGLQPRAWCAQNTLLCLEELCSTGNFHHIPQLGNPKAGMMWKSCSTICLLLWPSECIGLGSPAIEELSPPVPCANSPAVWLKPARVSKTLGLPSCCSFLFFWVFFFSVPGFSGAYLCSPASLTCCQLAAHWALVDFGSRLTGSS